MSMVSWTNASVNPHNSTKNLVEINFLQLQKTTTKPAMRTGKPHFEQNFSKTTQLKSPRFSLQAPVMSLMYFPMQTNYVTIPSQRHVAQAISSSSQNSIAKSYGEEKLINNNLSNNVLLQQCKIPNSLNNNNDQILGSNNNFSLKSSAIQTYVALAIHDISKNSITNSSREEKLADINLSNNACLQQCKMSYSFNKNNNQILRSSEDSFLKSSAIQTHLAQDGTSQDSITKPYREEKLIDINCLKNALLQKCKVPLSLNINEQISRSNNDSSQKFSPNTKTSTSATEMVAKNMLNCEVTKMADIDAVTRPKKPVDESFCFVCNVTCGSIELLQIHKDDTDFYCRVCTQKFTNHGELETHFTNHKRRCCVICKDVFYCYKDFHNHKQAHGEGNDQTECSICNKKFSKRSLKAHIKNMHTDKSTCDSPYTCIICSREFCHFKKLWSHLESAHLAYELLECHVCKKLFCGPDRLKSHFKTVHPPVEDDSIYTCKICQKVFFNKCTLINHMKSHKNLEKLCEICGKSVIERNMRLHKLREHAEIGVFPCKNCEEVFDTYYKLRSHSKSHFNSKSSVICDICGKKFKTPSVLKKHHVIHSEEKPFKCIICGASFKQKVTLSTHQRVHNDLGKYFCSNCGKSFRWKQTFTKHVTKCELNQESAHKQD